MKITTVGIDLAKNVFQVHGVDEHGKAVLRKQLRRDQVATFFVNLPPCLIGIEACASAHHWARKLTGMGHTVRLMAPQFVKPYVKASKNDAADAEAICEAVARPQHALLASEERRAAGGARPSSCAPGICQGTHRASQSDPRPTGRVRHHHPAGHRVHRYARSRADRRRYQRTAWRVSIAGASLTRSVKVGRAARGSELTSAWPATAVGTGTASKSSRAAARLALREPLANSP